MFGRNIDLNKEKLRGARLPLLVQEADWIKLFGESENKDIQGQKEELIKLIKEESELRAHSRSLEKQKIENMKKILKASDLVNNEANKLKGKDLKILDAYKEELLQINEEIEDVRFKLETLPTEIRNINFQLLNSTIQYGYDELKSREKTYHKSIVEIDRLKKKLKELFEIKYDNEEWINEAYIFLHGILGSEVIEEIDRKKFG